MSATDAGSDPNGSLTTLPTMPSVGEVAPVNSDMVLWNLDGLDADLLAVVLGTLVDFVDRVRGWDINVPRCWYVHGWVVRRLVVLQYWHGQAHGDQATPRAAADWWSLGLEPLTRDWTPLHEHHNRHAPGDRPWASPMPTPPLDEVMAGMVRSRREQPR